MPYLDAFNDEGLAEKRIFRIIVKKPLLAVGLVAGLIFSATGYAHNTPLWSAGRDVAPSAQVDDLTRLPYDGGLTQSIDYAYASRLGRAGVGYLKLTCNPVVEEKNGKKTAHSALDVLYMPSYHAAGFRLASRTPTQCPLGDIVAVELYSRSCGKSCYRWESEAYSRVQVKWSVMVLQLEKALSTVEAQKRQ